MPSDFLTIFLLNLAALIVMYYRAFLSEKAKNKATKEDIKDITLEIEEAKSEFVERNKAIETTFSKQIEELKAQLSYQNQAKMAIQNEKRNAFISLDKTMSELLFSIMRVSTSGYGLSNFENLSEISAKIDEKHYLYDIAESHLYIFYKNEEFILLSNEIGKLMAELQGIADRYIIDIIGVYRISTLNANATAIDKRIDIYKKCMMILRQKPKSSIPIDLTNLGAHKRSFNCNGLFMMK
ncbi:hypothetical protein MKQ70_16605 [Chitinophaga sedimenti]|uniref:hypothetical protein n=1 Tax=Chitinophaga sedimenti TaxID=2033606 RepID=UPI002003A0B2|nr:hypothetical protein [Chitinophaga sedimenti]MCK7556549.1 hypothetical protein [Chitinophaga sedimenti]